jgi:hypothetical protein
MEEHKMNISKLATTTLVALSFATTAFAGTLTEPTVEMVEPAAEGSSASSGSGILVPLLVLIAVGLLITSDDDDSSTPPLD